MTQPVPGPTERQIRRVLARRAPDLAQLPLRPLRHHGTETQALRVGRHHLMRLPIHPDGAAAIASAARWLPVIAPRLPLNLPEVVASGAAGPDLPLPWALHRWVDGRDAEAARPADLSLLATHLAAAIAALQALPVPRDRPKGRRGGPLAPQDAGLRAALARAEAMGLAEARAALPVWEAGLAAPAHADAPVWLHGDLMPGNLIVQDGRLSGLIDWSDVTTGDPAYDLIPAWFVFDRPARDRFLSALAPDAATLARARARVAWQCAMALPHYRDSNPVMMRLARRGLAALAEDHVSR